MVGWMHHKKKGWHFFLANSEERERQQSNLLLNVKMNVYLLPLPSHPTTLKWVGLVFLKFSCFCVISGIKIYTIFPLNKRLKFYFQGDWEVLSYFEQNQCEGIFLATHKLYPHFFSSFG